MSKIEYGAFSTLLRRYLGMKGVSDVVDELAPEISATLTLEQERLEWEFLKGARILAHAGFVPASVGNNSGVRFRNPATSGIVAIITKLHAGPGLNPAPANTAIAVTFGAQTADQSLGTSGTSPRDGRMIPPTGGAIIASTGYNAPGGSAIDGAMALIAGTSWIEFWNRDAVVLPPGFALNVSLGNVNLDLHTSCHWLEKRLDELEAR